MRASSNVSKMNQLLKYQDTIKSTHSKMLILVNFLNSLLQDKVSYVSVDSSAHPEAQGLQVPWNY